MTYCVEGKVKIVAMDRDSFALSIVEVDFDDSATASDTIDKVADELNIYIREAINDVVYYNSDMIDKVVLSATGEVTAIRDVDSGWCWNAPKIEENEK